MLASRGGGSGRQARRDGKLGVRERGGHNELMAVRPLLLMDIDGPLNPYAAPWAVINPAQYGYQFYVVGPVREHRQVRVLLNVQHGLWLRRLAEHFDLVWATTWEHDANRQLAPILGLPDDLPVITLWADLARTGRASWKTDAVAEWVGSRPFAWFDDEINEATRARLASWPGIGPHLAWYVDPRHGLRPSDVAALREFAAGLP